MYYADKFWLLLKIVKVYDMYNTGTYPLELLSSFNSSVKQIIVMYYLNCIL